MKRVLFVCVENSNRSQMAEAYARLQGAGILEAASAGSKPAGAVNPKAIAAMAEVGYDLSAHRPKSLTEVGDAPWDYVITMGCGDACPWVPSRHRMDWPLPDPRNLPAEGYRVVRDEIARRVQALVEKLRQEEHRELQHPALSCAPIQPINTIRKTGR